MAPGGEPTNLQGNAALYLYQSHHRQRVFLPRNINAVLEANATASDQIPRPPRRREHIPLDDIIDRIQHPHLRSGAGFIVDGAVLQIEAKGMRLKSGARAPNPRAKAYLCRCEVFVKHGEGREARDIFRNNEMCRVTPSADGTATIEMHHPVHIQGRKLYVLRKHGGKEALGLADSYKAGFVLSPVDPAAPWPPFGQDLHGGSKMESTFMATIPALPQATRARWHDLHLHHSGKRLSGRPAALQLELSVNWTNPIHKTASLSTTSRVREPVASSHLTWYTTPSSSPAQSFLLKGYGCPFCYGRVFPNGSTLHFHLLTSHDLFTYKLTKRKPELDHHTCLEITLDISPTPSLTRASNEVPDHRTFVWRTPSRPFSLPRLLRGDWSWLNERKQPAFSRAASNSLPPTRMSLTDVPDIPRRPKRFATAPETSLPPPVLLRSKSKRFIKPSECLSESDDDIDDGWLRLKTEQLLDDFEDVAMAEKKFMKLLNKHLLDERPAGAVYMPHVMVRFVRQYKAELLKNGLAVEFWKWLANSVMMGVLDAECVRVCMELLREGVEEGNGDFFGGGGVQERKGKRVKVEEKEPKWKGVCTCYRPWVRSEMVRCDGKTCKIRWFHRQCFDVEKRPQEWICPECEELEDQVAP